MPNLKLTDTQRVILSAAPARDSGLILPLPKSLTTNKAAIAKVLQSLLTKRLVIERPARLGEDAWKEDGERIALEISPVGLSAIGVESTSREVETAKPKKADKSHALQRRNPKAKPKALSKNSTRGPKPSSKLGLVIAALHSRKGATIDDLIETTSWQAHSIRGAISGALKKKLGLKVESSTVDGRGRVYRIAE